jgi:hypothetical protein
MKLARHLVALLLAAASLPGIASAQAGAEAQPDPSAPPVGDEQLLDPVFRVRGNGLGLERQVEMYQWAAQGAGDDKAWSAEPVAVPGDAQDGGNPPFPLQHERWLPAQITVDGHPLAPRLVAALATWRQFRPAFSALPGNLTATFQPEGDGLGSAENPLDPQVGDLRITWRERVLPSLDGRIELRDGEWVLRPDAPPTVAEAPAPRAWMLSWLPILVGAGGLLLLGVLLARKRRR